MKDACEDSVGYGGENLTTVAPLSASNKMEQLLRGRSQSGRQGVDREE